MGDKGKDMLSTDNEEDEAPDLGDQLEVEDKEEGRVKDNFQVCSLKTKTESNDIQ